MNTISNKMPMIWGALVLVMGLLYACPDASEDSTPTLKAGDITYNSIAQGTVGRATPTSSTITDFSTLTFSIAPIGTHTGTQVPPTIAEDGIITTATTTSAGSYRVTITPDGITILGNSITVDFYVSVNPANIEALDIMLEQAITDYGLTGDFNYIDTSDVTTMSHLFRSGYTPGTGTAGTTRTYVRGFNGDISQWDVSSVTDFTNMFEGATSFNQDISQWDVSSVTDFTNMFANTIAFNQDISQWEVFAGENFNGMFSGAAMFDQDIGKWKVSAGTNFSDMFSGATVFNQDISKWDVSSGENFSWMFSGATKFNQDISKWIVTKGTNFQSMFEAATAFDKDVSSWNLDPSNVNITDMFKDSGMTTLPSWYQQ